MNQTKTGKFIAKCRKEKKLTQAQLAEKLNITDRAVSKWETGKSMPDSSIMLELCEILGISVNELLSGEAVDMEQYEKKADENLIALKRKDESNRTKYVMTAVLFSITLLTGILVCLICNIALSGSLTWSLIPISSITFAWVIFFPMIISGKKAAIIGLISLSIFIIPYLFLLSHLTKTREVFSICTAMSVISIIFLWIIAALFTRVEKTRKCLALGIAFLSAIPFVFIVNTVLSKMIAEPVFDIWDMLTVFLLLIFAFIAFIFDYIRKKEKAE